MDKDKVFTLIARHLNVENYDYGVYEEELTAELEDTDKQTFHSLLDSLEKEGIIVKKRGLVFIGKNYESKLSLTQNNHNNNILKGNVFNAPVQVGGVNQMSISETDMLAIEKIIESLANNDDPTLVDSILNISKQAKDVYTKIKEWIGLIR